MKVEKIPFGTTARFSDTFVSYVKGDASLAPFYGLAPKPGNFLKQIALRNFPLNNRQTLVNALKKQYEGITISEASSENLESLLKPNTFTVTTGHQLNIFTGPLYFIYKIVTAINACKELNKSYPEYRFVPVYWMASEDHDFEEISYFHLFGKKYQWNTNQSGAVGRFDPKGLKEVLDSMPGHHPLFEKAYLKNSTLANAVRYYVNELFGKDGLVVVDGDDRSLKSLFVPAMKQDLFNHSPKEKVEINTNALIEAGHHTQIHAREINLFFLDDGLRTRIERTESGFTLVDSDITISDTEMEQILDATPEKLSPNVILRPLYQETILPNLAYIGGPAEVIYWFQLKEMFQFFGTPFPILLPRNFALVMQAPLVRKWKRTGFEIEDIFQEEEELIRRIALKQSTDSLNVAKEQDAIENAFTELEKKALSIDPTLGQHVDAWKTRIRNAVLSIEKKMIRAEKRRHSDVRSQVAAVQSELFPGGGLQERRDNFLNFQMSDPQFIEKVKASLDPFDLQFHIMIDE